MYLEDIIGTPKNRINRLMKLQSKRNAYRKIASSQIKMNRLRHDEKEKIALETQKKEAEDYLRLKNDQSAVSTISMVFVAELGERSKTERSDCNILLSDF